MYMHFDFLIWFYTSSRSALTLKFDPWRGYYQQALMIHAHCHTNRNSMTKLYPYNFLLYILEASIQPTYHKWFMDAVITRRRSLVLKLTRNGLNVRSKNFIVRCVHYIALLYSIQLPQSHYDLRMHKLTRVIIKY